MKKPRIRIFDTIGYGFYFALSKYGALLRLTWLPAVLAIVIFNTQTFVQLSARRGSMPEVGTWPEYTALLSWLPIYALMAIPAVAAYRMSVFGQPAPRGLAYFRLGGTELQFLAAQLVASVYMIIYIIFAMLVIVPATLGVHELLAVAEPTAKAWGIVGAEELGIDDNASLLVQIGAGASIMTGIAYLFGVVLFSMVQPVVVAERRIGIVRSLGLVWLGNAVRLSIVWFISGVTLFAVSGVLYSLAQQNIPGLFAEYILTDYDRRNLIHQLLMFNAVSILPSILIGTLVLGVTAGVNGFAYRQMVFSRKKTPPTQTQTQTQAQAAPRVEAEQ